MLKRKQNCEMWDGKHAVVLDMLTSFRVLVVTSTVVLLMFVYVIQFSDIPRFPDESPAFVPSDITKRIARKCEEKFNLTIEDNINVINNYPRGIADDYMWKLRGNWSTPEKIIPFPVIVTAFDKTYYPQAMGLFYSIDKLLMTNKKYAGQIKVIAYDMGISKRQVKVIQEKCNCELRRFPFEELPAHLRKLRTYAFKPIIIQKLLMEFGFVWWVDSSVRFLTPDVDAAIKYAVDNSMLFKVSTSPREDISITKQTDVRTFKFLEEDPCKFRPFGETWATVLLFHFDKLTKAVVNAWTVCALNKDCIAPPGTEDKGLCNMKQHFDGRCHRFDQSVLSIVTRRLFHEQNSYPLDTRVNSLYVVKRGHLVHYFEYCFGILMYGCAM